MSFPSKAPYDYTESQMYIHDLAGDLVTGSSTGISILSLVSTSILESDRGTVS